MIHGVGIEAVDVRRFSRAYKRHGKRLLERLFTKDEIAYCTAKRAPERHFAARYAAKTGLFKALGRRLKYSEVEVTRSAAGMPGLKVTGLGGGLVCSLTMTHDGDYSIAQVIIERVE